MVRDSCWYVQRQVQHSLVDMRPQQRMAELCQHTGVKLITSLSLSHEKNKIKSALENISPKHEMKV